MSEHPHLWDVLTYVRWAVEHSDLPPTDRLLAVAVATQYSHTDGYARPSWPGLMATYGMSRSTLARAMARITAAGIWRTETHAKRATRYRFPIGAAVHRGVTSDTPDSSTGVSPVTPQGCHPRHPNQLEEPGKTSVRDAISRAAPVTPARFDYVAAREEREREGISWRQYLERERRSGRTSSFNRARFEHPPAIVDVDTGDHL